MLIPPLNDKKCLTHGHDEALRFSMLSSTRARAAGYANTDELAEDIRWKRQRDDLGDPNDGPRIPCEVSQRMRLDAIDPNCLERTVEYLGIAELIDPGTERTSATMILDGGWHTFPVEFRNGLPHIVVLDPYDPPPRNAMLCTAYNAQRISPGTSKRVAPWFLELARNACLDDGVEDCFDCAIASLRHSLITGQPIQRIDELAHVLALAGRDAQLWGARGRSAFERVHHSIRNLSLDLDRDGVGTFLKELLDTGERLAPHALKAALIAKFGPAAAIALEGAQVGVVEDEASKNTKDKSTSQKTGSLDLALEDSKNRASQEEEPKPKLSDRLRQAWDSGRKKKGDIAAWHRRNRRNRQNQRGAPER